MSRRVAGSLKSRSRPGPLLRTRARHRQSRSRTRPCRLGRGFASSRRFLYSSGQALAHPSNETRSRSVPRPTAGSRALSRPGGAGGRGSTHRVSPPSLAVRSPQVLPRTSQLREAGPRSRRGRAARPERGWRAFRCGEPGHLSGLPRCGPSSHELSALFFRMCDLARLKPRSGDIAKCKFATRVKVPYFSSTYRTIAHWEETALRSSLSSCLRRTSKKPDMDVWRARCGAEEAAGR